MTTELRLRVIRAERTEEHLVAPDKLGGFVIGRNRDADVCIHHPGVSRRHCRMSLRDGTLFVEDLGSASGTHVHEQRLEPERPCPLEDGDRIAVGPIAVEIHITDGAMEEENTVVEPPAQMSRDYEATIVRGEATMPGAAAETLHSDTEIALTGDEIIIGRQDTCDVTLDNLLLSRRHARLFRKADAWFIEDLNSTNGTYVNGQPLKASYVLEEGDVVKIGPYELVFERDHLVSRVLDEEGIAVGADSLTKTANDRDTGVPIKLLDDASFRINPGDFVGLLGPSGCGKSTLMDALNGRRPAPDGRVWFNEDDLYRNFDAYKVGIGYVPQELIFHESLPLEDALRYASRIRLSKDVTDEEIERNIDHVLSTVGLAERRKTTIKDLSGGQKKRVSLAIELLSKPNVLFLDEVTSGLDLGTEKEMMQLFRKLADDGITVICITHFVDSLEQCNKLVCLMRGRVVFYGPPGQLREHFGIDRIAGIYDVLKNVEHADKKQMVELSEREAERRRDEFVKEYGDPAAEVRRTDVRAERRIETMESSATGHHALDLDVIIQQTKILTTRYVQLLTRDRMTTGTLIALAPLIAILLCLLVWPLDPDLSRAATYEPLELPDQAALAGGAAELPTQSTLDANMAEFREAAAEIRSYAHKQKILGFGAILTVLFLALFGSVQEVVKELKIYHHERFARLQLGPYMISKLLPLSVIGAIQAALVVIVIRLFSDIEAGNLLEQFLLLFMTAFAGTCLGLAISAAVPEKSRDGTPTDAATLAVMLMNAVVIPQVLFAGAMVELQKAPELLAQLLVTAYWSFESYLSLVGPAVDEAARSVQDAQLLKVAEDSRGESIGYAAAFGVVVLHAAIFVVLFAIALARKDGPDGFRRMLRKLPRDYRALAGQARQAVRRKTGRQQAAAR